VTSEEKLGFRDIAARIRTEIVDGRYPTATLLPPEPELAARFGASRSLVNRAMTVLAAEGLIRPQQGRGTIVTWLPPMLHSPARYRRSTREHNQARGAFDAEVLALGLVPQHEITVERAAPPAHIAELLGVTPGEVTCLVRQRRLLASGIPVRLNKSWIPLEIAEGTPLEDPSSVLVGGVKTVMADLGYPQTAGRELMSSRLPTEVEARVLEISPDRTVMDIVHMGYTAAGRVVEVTTTVAPAHYLTFDTDTFPLD
jgi:GntR family transcriptional regulator